MFSMTQNELELKKDKEIELFVNRSKEDLIRLLNREAKIDNIPQKLEWIIKDIKNKRANIFSDPITKALYFKTKSFWVVDDIEMATEIICIIKKIYGCSTADGIRFGVDYSFNSSSDASTIGVHKKHFPELYERIDTNGINVSTGYALTSLDELNCVPLGSDPILDEFSTQNDGSIDVLIIVGKYIMGYDNPDLVTVYCDTDISEVSRIYQLATRPATKRKHKKCGFFVDLSLGNKNAMAYKNAIHCYEQSNKEITTFVLDAERITELNDKLETTLNGMANILDATYPDDFKNINRLSFCLEKLETTNIKNKSDFFVKLTQINKIIKDLAIPINYPKHSQALSVLGIAIGNFFDLLKAKKENVIRFTKDDIKSEINELFVALGFDGGIKDVLDYQIKYAQELDLSTTDLESVKVNKAWVMLKTKVETDDKHINASIYEKIKELIQYCEQNNSIDSKIQTIEKIDALKEERIKERNALNSQFDSPYERVVHEMLTAWIDGIFGAKIWSEGTYKDIIHELGEISDRYFKLHADSVDKQKLKEAFKNPYSKIWGDALKKNEGYYQNNPHLADFRQKAIAFHTQGKVNQDLTAFLDNLVETLVLTFEESKGMTYA